MLDEINQDSANESHSQQESLKRIVAPNIRRRISPAMETHPTSEILTFRPDRAKLDAKRNALPGIRMSITARVNTISAPPNKNASIKGCGVKTNISHHL
jgi:hypothetical protein